MKEIKVNNKIIRINDIVSTTEGKARLDYIGRQSFTNWTLLDQKSNIFPFGRPITIEDNNLNDFII